MSLFSAKPAQRGSIHASTTLPAVAIAFMPALRLGLCRQLTVAAGLRTGGDKKVKM